jgi:hypothetical protein
MRREKPPSRRPSTSVTLVLLAMSLGGTVADWAKGDYSLLPGSPAIEAAKLDAALVGQVPADHRGRSRLQGKGFDMGAFESPRVPPPSPR